jgi:hypothetical protein
VNKTLDFSRLTWIFACESKSSSRSIVGVFGDFAEWRKYGDRRFSEDKGKLSNRHHESADLVVVVEVDLFFFKDAFLLSPSSNLCLLLLGPWLAQSCLSASQSLAIYVESQDSFWCTPQSRLQDSARHKIRNLISKMIMLEKNSVC